jgi:hypothetical protein
MAGWTKVTWKDDCEGEWFKWQELGTIVGKYDASGGWAKYEWREVFGGEEWAWERNWRWQDWGGVDGRDGVDGAMGVEAAAVKAPIYIYMGA